LKNTCSKLIMASSTSPNGRNNSNGDEEEDNEDNEVVLWQDLEEQELVDIPIHATATLHLRQYISHDDRWGIHSSVWEGGLALLAYFSTLQPPIKDDGLILDLGSGTGIVGLGLAELLGDHSTTNIWLTDLEEAMPLLNNNIQRNGYDNKDTTSSTVVTATPLVWGQPLPTDIRQAIANNASHVYVLGADIVYRHSIMDPLIDTLQDLLRASASNNNVTCLLSTHSIRTHLPEFFQRCQEHSLLVDHIALVTLPEDDRTQAAQSSTVTFTTTELLLDPTTSLPKPKSGMVSIVQIRLKKP
jgi:predicted nicotinamide N-methyase